MAIHKIKHWIFEGVDRLGKDSLIRRIQDTYGFHQCIHYQKPEKLECYVNTPVPPYFNSPSSYSLKLYQERSFSIGMTLLNTRIPTIFNRFHLGECVYAPLYRHYDGDYVFDLEEDHSLHLNKSIRMILLTTSNFEFIKDDGLSFDFSKKAEEQEMFIKAFKLSIIQDKVIIDVHNGNGGFKTFEEIFAEATYE